MNYNPKSLFHNKVFSYQSSVGGLSVSADVRANHSRLMALKGFSDSPKRPLQAAALAGANTLREHLARELSSSGSGIWWSHLPARSSAPGEYPARQTGRLVESLRTGVVDSPANQGRAVLGAGRNLPRHYAFYLEYGTAHMEPRPFMRRSAEQYSVEVYRSVRSEIREQMGRK